MNGSDFFIIQHGSFHAAVLYSALEHLPIHNLKKLFRLAKKAQETMRAAARAYEDGWKKVDKPRSRNPKTVEQLRLNKELTVRFKQAHARYERLVASRKVFEETLFPDTKHPMN